MIITYERDPDVGNGFVAFRGQLEWPHAEDPNSCVSDDTMWGPWTRKFKGYDFGAIIRDAHANLHEGDDAVRFVRSDQPNATPYDLPPEMVKLLREKPEELIERMSYPEIRVVVGRPPAPPATLRSCSDTLADAFGTRVLCRRRPDMVECPGCGAWVPVMDSGINCGACSCAVQVESCDKYWVYVRVEDLLATSLERFFLPREWNMYRPWVRRDALQKLYQDFLADKEKFK
jgi:hypothetical protein